MEPVLYLILSASYWPEEEDDPLVAGAGEDAAPNNHVHPGGETPGTRTTCVECRRVLVPIAQ